MSNIQLKQYINQEFKNVVYDYFDRQMATSVGRKMTTWDRDEYGNWNMNCEWHCKNPVKKIMWSNVPSYDTVIITCSTNNIITIWVHECDVDKSKGDTFEACSEYVRAAELTTEDMESERYFGLFVHRWNNVKEIAVNLKVSDINVVPNNTYLTLSVCCVNGKVIFYQSKNDQFTHWESNLSFYSDNTWIQSAWTQFNERNFMPLLALGTYNEDQSKVFIYKHNIKLNNLKLVCMTGNLVNQINDMSFAPSLNKFGYYILATAIADRIVLIRIDYKRAHLHKSAIFNNIISTKWNYEATVLKEIHPTYNDSLVSSVRWNMYGNILTSCNTDLKIRFWSEYNSTWIHKYTFDYNDLTAVKSMPTDLCVPLSIQNQSLRKESCCQEK